MSAQDHALALAAADRVMVLTAVSPLGPDGRPPVLAKTFAPDATGSLAELSSYGGAFLFDAHDVVVESPEALCRLLERTSRHPHSCIIRGGLADGSSVAAGIVRRIHDRSDGFGAPFAGRRVTVIPLDFDGTPLPDGMTLADPVAVVRYIVSLLPTWAAGVDVVWQLTSGWGIKPGIRLRLYLLADRGLSTDELELIFAGSAVKIDPAPFRPVQVIYTAAPIVLGGVDPVPARIGLLRGSQRRAEVGAALEAAKAAEVAGGAPRGSAGVPGGLGAAGAGLGFDGFVAAIGDEPAVAGGLGFNAPINSAIASAFASLGSGLDADALEARLAAVIVERWGLTRAKDKAGLQRRLRDLKGNIRNVRRMQETAERRRQDEARAAFAEVLGDDAGVVRPTMTADEVAAALEGPLVDFFAAADQPAAARILHFAAAREVNGAAQAAAACAFSGNTLEDAPVGLALVGLGIGKTRGALGTVVAFVDGAFAVAGGWPQRIGRRVAFAVPDHKLAADIQARFEQLRPGIASVWRGTEQPDPKAPGEKMCRRSADMDAWRRAGGDSDDLCAACPLSGVCGYIRQRRECRTPVVILAGPAVAMDKPPPKLKRRVREATATGGEKVVAYPAFDALVVDETRAQAWLEGFDTRPVVAEPAIATGQLRPADPAATRGAAEWTPADWARFDDQMARLDTMITAAVGALTTGASRHLTFGELRSVCRDEQGWERLRDALAALLPRLDPITGAQSGEALRAALAGVARWTERVSRLRDFCTAAAQAERDAWREVPSTTLRPEGGEEGEEGDDVGAVMRRAGDADPVVQMIVGLDAGWRSGVRLRWRKEVHPEWRGVATLALDATADVELLKRWWWRMAVIAEGRAKLPDAVTVLQVHDDIVPYRRIAPRPLEGRSSDKAKAERKTALRNVGRLARLVDALCGECREAGGVGLVVPLATETALLRVWRSQVRGKPDGLVLGHYGAIRGVDSFRDVRVMVTVSRPSPPPIVVEDIAEVIAGRPLARIQPDAHGRVMWAQGDRRYLMRDGTSRNAVLAERHPDPFVERIRRQIVDAELDQAAGRDRAVRRGVSRPLLHIRMSAQPSETLEVDELVELKDVLCMDPIDALIARGVVVPVEKGNRGSSEVLAQALSALAQTELDDPSETVTAKAAEHASERGKTNTRKISLNPPNPLGVLTIRGLGDSALFSGYFSGAPSSPAAAPPPGWSRWRVKSSPASRYWTQLLLELPLACPQSDDRARALLASLGVTVHTLEPLHPQPPRPRGRPRRAGTAQTPRPRGRPRKTGLAPPIEQPQEPTLEGATSGISASEVSAPEASPPESSMPETPAPEVSAPEVSVPKVSAPEVSAPEVSTPEVSTPEVSAPGGPAEQPPGPEPKVSAPETPKDEPLLTVMDVLTAAGVSGLRFRREMEGRGRQLYRAATTAGLKDDLARMVVLKGMVGPAAFDAAVAAAVEAARAATGVRAKP